MTINQSIKQTNFRLVYIFDITANQFRQVYVVVVHPILFSRSRRLTRRQRCSFIRRPLLAQSPFADPKGIPPNSPIRVSKQKLNKSETNHNLHDLCASCKYIPCANVYLCKYVPIPKKSKSIARVTEIIIDAVSCHTVEIKEGSLTLYTFYQFAGCRQQSIIRVK